MSETEAVTQPVDSGASSTPMNVPLTPENKAGLSWGKVNKDNGLPDEMSLSDIFSRIKVTATEAATLLAHWASLHHGGPNQELSDKLNKEAAKVANPDTYKQDADTNR